MAKVITEKVYNDRDNSIDLLLTANGVAQSLDNITKVELVEVEGDVDAISSADHPTWFDWDTGVTGKIIIKLGSAELTSKERYLFNLILYDAVNTNGIDWGRIAVEVR